MSRNDDVAETIEYRGHKILVLYDRNAESPRENDNLGRMVCWHRNYNLGDRQTRLEPTGYKSHCSACGNRTYKTVEEIGHNKCGHCQKDALVNYTHVHTRTVDAGPPFKDPEAFRQFINKAWAVTRENQDGDQVWLSTWKKSNGEIERLWESYPEHADPFLQAEKDAYVLRSPDDGLEIKQTQIYEKIGKAEAGFFCEEHRPADAFDFIGDGPDGCIFCEVCEKRLRAARVREVCSCGEHTSAERWEELEGWGEGAGSEVIALGLLDHSGLHIYSGGGPHWTDGAGWDSGTVGYIYATPADIVKEYGADTPETRETARKLMESEVEAYDAYLKGDVYGFAVEAGEDEDGNEMPQLCDFSCFGFYPNDSGRYENRLSYMLEEAKAEIDHAIKREEEEVAKIKEMQAL